MLELRTGAGELKIVPEPAGTRGGYDDLRRAATREPIGKGLRPRVADRRPLRAENLRRLAVALDDLDTRSPNSSAPSSAASSGRRPSALGT